MTVPVLCGPLKLRLDAPIATLGVDLVQLHTRNGRRQRRADHGPQNFAAVAVLALKASTAMSTVVENAGFDARRNFKGVLPWQFN